MTEDNSEKEKEACTVNHIFLLLKELQLAKGYYLDSLSHSLRNFFNKAYIERV